MLYKAAEALYEKALALAGKMIFRLGVKIVYAKRVRPLGGCAQLLKMADNVLLSVARRDLPMHLVALALVKAIKPAELERFSVRLVKLYLAAQLPELGVRHIFKLKLVAEHAEGRNVKAR